MPTALSALGLAPNQVAVLKEISLLFMVACDPLAAQYSGQSNFRNYLNYSAGIAKITMPASAAAITPSPIVISHLRVPDNSTHAWRNAKTA